MSYETDEYFRKVRDWVKVCDLVAKRYPIEYEKLVFSDIRDQEFRKKIKRLYQSVISNNGPLAQQVRATDS